MSSSCDASLLKLGDIQQYNTAMSQWIEGGSKEGEEPSACVLMDKYRIRVLPLASLPFVSNYSNHSQLGFTCDDVIVVDSKEKSITKTNHNEKSTVLSRKSIKSEVLSTSLTGSMDHPMSMETEEDEENKENGPLHTSFLSLSKLEKDGNQGNVEIVGLDCQIEFFDANPIPFDDAVSLQRFLRTDGSKYMSPDLSKFPIWISTGPTSSSISFPSVCWLASGQTSKSLQRVSGCTRILGYFDENSQKMVKQMNEACGAAQVNRYRAVYDVIRRVGSEMRTAPGEVIVDMRWNTKSSFVLLEQPDNAADCTIRIDLGWRDNRFFINDDIFEQLFFVINLAEVLANPEKEVVFPEWSNVVKFGDLCREMDELVEACAKEDNVFASNERSEEVTDKVWNIVRKCGDVKHATMLFKSFLQALTYGKIKSHVQERNKSHLASLIRASKTGDFRMPILERLSTIEMMMEIGVESLRGRIINIFTSTLQFPSDELSLILKTCENDLSSSSGSDSMNANAIALLPITMALATTHQIFGLLNEKDHVILPDLARRVLTKFTNSLIEKAKKGETETDYVFETTLPLLRMNKETFCNKRPRIWTCENSQTVGANVQTRMMTSLELEPSMEHVARMVNAARPIRDELDEEPKKPTAEELRADYTITHTVFSYFPKI